MARSLSHKCQERCRFSKKIDRISMGQRRMGVEPTGDRAERPPSRFEDGETHRSPYTSIAIATPCIVACLSRVVKPVLKELPAGEHQDCCQDGTHDAVGDVFAFLNLNSALWHKSSSILNGLSTSMQPCQLIIV